MGMKKTEYKGYRFYRAYGNVYMLTTPDNKLVEVHNATTAKIKGKIDRVGNNW